MLRTFRYGVSFMHDPERMGVSTTAGREKENAALRSTVILVA